MTLSSEAAVSCGLGWEVGCIQPLMTHSLVAVVAREAGMILKRRLEHVMIL
jgi:hypothetical protein